jgi:hypothetical protein
MELALCKSAESSWLYTLGRSSIQIIAADLVKERSEYTVASERVIKAMLSTMNNQPGQSSNLSVENGGNGKSDEKLATTLSASLSLDRSDIMMLINLLNEENEQVWELAQEVLKEIGEPAVGPLIINLEHGSEQVRILAAETLGHLGDIRAVPPLMALLKDSNSEVREATREALKKLIVSIVLPASSPSLFMLNKEKAETT